MGWVNRAVSPAMVHECRLPEYISEHKDLPKEEEQERLRNGWVKKYGMATIWLQADVQPGAVWQCDDCGVVYECVKGGDVVRHDYYPHRRTLPHWKKAVIQPYDDVQGLLDT